MFEELSNEFLTPVEMNALIAGREAELFGVDAAAIVLLLVECIRSMLVLSGDMINRANGKIVEASLLGPEVYPL